MLIDKKFRVPRLWSNQELKKFADLFTGDVINVSGWLDLDKEGGYYKDYFSLSSNYFISNHPTLGKGYQGNVYEIKLDLEKELPSDYIERFDVVFNHTTLEHIYNFHMAFHNICLMSRDIVILVVPFLQQVHGMGFEDYWRFTPKAIIKLFEAEEMEVLYINYNKHIRASVYIFCIASKYSDKWNNIIKPCSEIQKKILWDPYEKSTGSKSIVNNIFYRLGVKIKDVFKKKEYY